MSGPEFDEYSAFRMAESLGRKPIDPHADVMFRGKPITALSREEAIDALSQALSELKRLNSPYAR